MVKTQYFAKKQKCHQDESNNVPCLINVFGQPPHLLRASTSLTTLQQNSKAKYVYFVSKFTKQRYIFFILFVHAYNPTYCNLTNILF